MHAALGRSFPSLSYQILQILHYAKHGYKRSV